MNRSSDAGYLVKIPYMPMFWSDYFADTRRLSCLEHGIYCQLIGEYWLHGGLPVDDQKLAKLVGLDNEEWGKHCSSIACLFLPGWRHKRIDKELDAAKRKHDRRVIAGSKGGQGAVMTHKLGKQQCLSNATPLLKQPEPEPEPDKKGSTLLPYKDSQIEPLSVFEKPTFAEVEKKVRRKNEYPSDFLEFWKGYPTDANMSKLMALKRWKSLDDEDRRSATESLPSYRSYCVGKPDYRPKHACGYLSERRFEGHVKIASKTSALVFVKLDTKQWDAWKIWWTKEHGKTPPSNGNGGWYFPSTWPPGHAEESDTAMAIFKPATNPPATLADLEKDVLR